MGDGKKKCKKRKESRDYLLSKNRDSDPQADPTNLCYPYILT